MTDRPARAAPRLPASPLELRLYALAVLAVVYLVAWRAIAAGGSPGPVTPTAAAQPGPGAATTVWLDDLPPAQRPSLASLALPAGWRIATRGERAVAATAPRVVRAPTPRALRVRTRSS